MSEIRIEIDQEFKSLLPELTEEEYESLEESILKEGCRDQIVVWRQELDTGERRYILLDGHNRFEICKEYGILYDTHEIELESRGEAIRWIIENQTARRNLTPDHKRKLIEKLLEISPEKSDRQIARETKTSHSTVGSTRRRMEARGEVAKLSTSLGSDGKEYPRKKSKQSTEYERSDEELLKLADSVIRGLRFMQERLASLDNGSHRELYESLERVLSLIPAQRKITVRLKKQQIAQSR